MAEFTDVLVADLARTAGVIEPRRTLPRAKLIAASLVTIKGVAVIGFRLSHAVGKRSRVLGAVVKQVTHAITGADIDYSAEIGPGLRLLHPTGVVVGAGARIGANCTLHPCTISTGPLGSPVLGDGVQIAPGARILHGTVIGDRCRVGANAVVVTAQGESDLVYLGVPARPKNARMPRVTELEAPQDPVAPSRERPRRARAARTRRHRETRPHRG